MYRKTKAPPESRVKAPTGTNRLVSGFCQTRKSRRPPRVERSVTTSGSSATDIEQPPPVDLQHPAYEDTGIFRHPVAWNPLDDPIPLVPVETIKPRQPQSPRLGTSPVERFMSHLHQGRSAREVLATAPAAPSLQADGIP